MIEYAKDTDVVIHEVMPMPESMVEFDNQPPERAIRASCGFHTWPPAFGKIMSELKPRHAIAFHWFNEEGTRYLQYDGIRETYDGPLSMATDMMVWNITPDNITERMAVSTDEAWDVEGPNPGLNPDNKVPPQLSDAMKAGVWDTTDAERATVETFNRKYGPSN